MATTKKVAEVEEVKEEVVAETTEAPKAKKTTAKKTTVKKTTVKKTEVEAEAKEEVAAPKKTVKKTVKKTTTKKAAAKEEKKPEVKEFKWRKATIRDFDIIDSPIVTEKTQNLQVNHNTMVFKVAKNTTANEVKDAIEAIFGVKVDKVNIVNVARKAKRVGQYNGHVAGYKKAYVVINKDYNLGDIARASQDAE